MKNDERERMIPHQVYITELEKHLNKLRWDGEEIHKGRDTTSFGHIRIPQHMKEDKSFRLANPASLQFIYERCKETLDMVSVDAMKAERELDRYKEKYGPLPMDLGEEI